VETGFLPALECLATLAVGILALFDVDSETIHLPLELFICNERVLIASLLLLSDIHTQDFATTGMLDPEAGQVAHKFMLISIRLHMLVSAIQSNQSSKIMQCRKCRDHEAVPCSQHPHPA
jgi:hypothetical protein